ncbi:NAD-dependent protein deacetylase sirtuin-7 [Anthonomus grandis grandis]|uniref:NAD-dependent protein deacetylase sirtuin-7 n=1 Tax=Anthonomus grandis grandis TaxID=2921223 RepID=UPI0021659F4D|nr:NAD-dependent protein deacetylase sirtuin-7 [Anthonomus grandis grandis]
MEKDCEDSTEGDSTEFKSVEKKRVRLLRPQTLQPKKTCPKEERHSNLRKVSLILQKPPDERTPEDHKSLEGLSDFIDEAQQRLKRRVAIKKRLEEFEDPEEVLTQKCQVLAQAVAQSRHLVVYTGAGISTAAKIPDYRGPNGIWTRLKEGKAIGDHDLSLAEPTYTHMALYELYRQKILKYVVSQNCDGLHLRSGLPRTALSELHGNMYIEVCKSCKPPREYWRLFDVTESTARYAHKTYRRCYYCNGSLVDTIVHFGERGSLQWPLNWKGACRNAKEATTIICLGSSLKVLKKYPWLWQMDKPVKKRPNLYIVNLQWTPKDDCANVKINGKCDVVFKKVMEMLGIEVPNYKKGNDPIFHHASELNELELHTNSQPCLVPGSPKREEFPKIESSSVDVKSDHEEDCFSSSNSSCSTSDLNLNCDNFSSEENSFLEPSLAFLSYNFLQTRIFGPYTDLFLYPYQTSFLYSGLHSIIEPMPAIKEENYPKLEPVVPESPSCDFCHRNFKTLTCQFYQKAEPVFEKQKYRYSKVEKKEKPNVCVCCDYTTEEEDIESASEEGSKEGSSDQKIKIQAGWFGKGYRKSRRFKRKAVEYK